MIVLSSGVLEVTRVIKPTKAVMFEELRVGDKIRITLPVKHLGTSRGRSYSTDLQIENLQNGHKVYKSMNTLSPILGKFEFKNNEL